MTEPPEHLTRRIRHGYAFGYVAELDVDTLDVALFFEESRTTGRELLGHGRFELLPPPLGSLRGRLITDVLEGKLLAELEATLGRGNPAWSFDQGPWVEAERAALSAGVGAYEAELLRKVMWLYYAHRWPLKFTEGCGFGPEGPAPLVAAALAEPQRMRARWELLILTGALLWPPADGDLDDMGGGEADDFYAEP